VNKETPLYFVADTAAVPDSAVSTIRAWLSTVPLPVQALNQSASVTANSDTALVIGKKRKALIGGPPPELSTCNNSTDVKFEQKQFTILLGESKYYCVVENGDKIEIKDDGDFANPPTNRLPGATFDDLVAANGSEKNPVYWEYKKPDGTDLTKEMIRLIGRYWEEGKTFKATLTVHADGKDASIDIVVLKPGKLGNKWQQTKDVHGVSFNIDDTCIVYGGKFGIPPHFLKAQIFNEASKNLDGVVGKGFAPTYLYEPYTYQYKWAWKNDKRYKHGMWLVDTKRTNQSQWMGTGKPVSDHSNVQDFTYPTIPHTVWDMIRDHSQLVNATSGFSHTKYGKRNPDGTMDFYPDVYKTINNKYNELLELVMTAYFFGAGVPGKTYADISREYMINYLQNDWEGGAINSDAQTRVASSYGWFQFMYSTAVEDPILTYPNSNHEVSPEDLNETDRNFSYALIRQKNILKKILGQEKESKGEWNLGFEKTFKDKVWRTWNSQKKNYSTEIANTISMFKPSK
jgi:hypothetical protein